MRTETSVVYIADDGTKFTDEAACVAHETKLLADAPWTVVAGKTAEELQAAVQGGDRRLGDCIEGLARMVREGRYSRGELKASPRRRKAEEAPASVQPGLPPTPPTFDPDREAAA